MNLRQLSVEHYGRGRKVNLVGHSWGAMLASAYMGRYPEKVDHAVLAVIPNAGHEMFAENPGASIAAVRAYLNSPAR